jgi:hypothetical protein
MDNKQWTMDNRQYAMGNRQWTIGDGQFAIGNRQWAMISFLRFNFRILCLKIKSIIQINLALQNQLSALKTLTKIHNQTSKSIISR